MSALAWDVPFLSRNLATAGCHWEISDQIDKDKRPLNSSVRSNPLIGPGTQAVDQGETRGLLRRHSCLAKTH